MKTVVVINVDVPDNVIGQMRRGGFQVCKRGDRMVIKVGTYTSDPLKTTIDFTSVNELKEPADDVHVA